MLDVLGGKTGECIQSEPLLKREFVDNFFFTRARDYRIVLQRPSLSRGVIWLLEGFAVALGIDSSLGARQRNPKF
jgi:hypothetical protein